VSKEQKSPFRMNIVDSEAIEREKRRRDRWAITGWSIVWIVISVGVLILAEPVGRWVTGSGSAEGLVGLVVIGGGIALIFYVIHQIKGK